MKSLSYGGKCADQAADEPEHRDGADRVGRQEIAPTRHDRVEPAVRPDQREHKKDEGELSDLDTDVERQQRGGQQSALDAEPGEGAREADAVDKAKGARNRPRIARGQPDFTPALAYHFDANKDDAERDAGVQWSLRDPDQSEGGHSQRDAVPDGERRDRLEQPPAAVHDPDQP